jgi:high-affinity iron transporter
MATLDDFFSFQVFLIVLRETLELAIIVSVLLAFLHQSFVTPKKASSGYTLVSTSESIQGEEAEEENADQAVERSAELQTTYRYLRLQVWVGGLLGLVGCLLLGTVILGVFYVIGNDLWSVTEHYWEGTFSIVASVIISVMGIKILRVNKMQEKWKAKLTVLLQQSKYLDRAINYKAVTQNQTMSDRIENFSEKYSMFILPFVTTLREGMEAIVFIGGIGINDNTSIAAILISVSTAIVIGTTVGVILYRTGNSLSLQWFLIASTCFLYLIAAGLFSKGVWNFELQRFIDLCDGFDVSETGHGPGSYDISTSVWHVNCCNGELQDDGAFWMIVTAIFGWTNSATYGSVISYIVYWIVVTTAFLSLLFEEKHGYLPVIPVKWQLRRIKKKLKANQKLIPDAVARVSVDSTTPLTR